LFNREAVQHCVQFKWSSEQSQLAAGDTEIHSLSLNNTAELPEQIQSLLNTFDDLFQEPTSMPPRRSFDHHIQLLLGAPPVNIRPYKYSLAQKDEIERQIAEMLKMALSNLAKAHMLHLCYL
jgi:hypothetical protein